MFVLVFFLFALATHSVFNGVGIYNDRLYQFDPTSTNSAIKIAGRDSLTSTGTNWERVWATRSGSTTTYYVVSKNSAGYGIYSFNDTSICTRSTIVSNIYGKPTNIIVDTTDLYFSNDTGIFQMDLATKAITSTTVTDAVYDMTLDYSTPSNLIYYATASAIHTFNKVSTSITLIVDNSAINSTYWYNEDGDFFYVNFPIQPAALIVKSSTEVFFVNRNSTFPKDLVVWTNSAPSNTTSVVNIGSYETGAAIPARGGAYIGSASAVIWGSDKQIFTTNENSKVNTPISVGPYGTYQLSFFDTTQTLKTGECCNPDGCSSMSSSSLIFANIFLILCLIFFLK